MSLLLAQTPAPEPTSVTETGSLVVQTLEDLWEGFLANLPLIIVGLVLFVIGLLVARQAQRGAIAGVQKAIRSGVLAKLAGQMVKLLILFAFALLALAVAGVDVGAALAGAGLVGLVVGLALQAMLENVVAGLVIIFRKPFLDGEQVVLGEVTGTVVDVNLRDTKVSTVDGELAVIPNGMVLNDVIVNLTREGARRTRAAIGVDYRDDADAVAPLLEEVVANVEGVRADPPVKVICVGLGSSSVDFEIRYWTDPEIATYWTVQDRVLRAAKNAVEEAGMTIPWPIRTLVMDAPLEMAGDTRSDGRSAAPA